MSVGWFILMFLTLGNALLMAGEATLARSKRKGADSPGLGKTDRSRPEGIDSGMMTQFIRYSRNLTGIGFGLVLAGSLTDLAAAFAFSGPWARAGIWFGAFALAGTVHFFLGEMIPRALGLNYPGRARGLSFPVLALARLASRPVVGVLQSMMRAVFAFFRLDVDPRDPWANENGDGVSLSGEGMEETPVTAMILRNALNMEKRVAQDILLPRGRIQYLDLTDPTPVNLDIIRRSGHTRFPLCEGDLDRCIGLVHIKDIVRLRGDWSQIDLRGIRRDMIRFSLDDTLDTVLERLLRQKRHMALVTDEFGGTVGVVTLEDVLEELVGDIQDEFDREEVLIKPLEGGEFQVEGLAPIHEVAEALGVEIGNGEVSTFGGYIVAELGRMPQPDTSVRLGRLHIRITGATEKRVTGTVVRVERAEEDFRSD